MSTRTLGTGFGDTIARFCAATGKNIEEVHTGVSLRLFRAVILSSPVLTGRLRANWICTLNAPSTSTTNATGLENLVSMGQTIEEHQPGQAIILANNLPYVERIEYDGWSHTKAPRGMVRINITRFKKLLEEEIRRVRRQ